MREGAYGSWRIVAGVNHWLSPDCLSLVDAPRYVPTWVGENRMHTAIMLIVRVPTPYNTHSGR